MKIFTSFLLLFLSLHSFAQEECVDPSLIDPNQICTFIYDPVCGCDGETYSNSCIATYSGGVTSWTPGECSTGGGCVDLTGLDFGDCTVGLGIGFANGSCVIISGCSYIVDGTNYSGNFYDTLAECSEVCGSGTDCVDLANVDFGLCAMPLGIALINGSCISISGCDYTVDEVDYSGFFYDDYADCQEFCETVECVNPDQIDLEMACDLDFTPVCGCDGVTYSNECHAINYGGVVSWTMGECGVTQVGDCEDVSGIDFGACDLFLGYAIVDGSCFGVSGCGYLVDEVDYTNAFYEDQFSCVQSCGDEECINPDQIDESMGCFDLFEPVCGCDNVTYSNECYAFFYGGVTSWTAGECNTADPCDDLSGLDFGLCDMVLGVTIIEGQCTNISGCGYIIDDVDYTNAFFDSLEDCEDNCDTCLDENQINPDHICTQGFEPVCGCDQVTYTNECAAFYFYGVQDWTAGACETAATCYNEDFDGSTDECSDQEDFVCGCDEITYLNACVAFNSGIQSWSPGACAGDGVYELTKTEFDVYPIPLREMLNINPSEYQETYNLQLVDALGRIVLEAKQLQGNQGIDVAAIVPGYYQLLILDTKGQVIHSKKMIK